MTSKSKAKPRLSGRMLPIMHPDAAGIDIGAEEIFVAVPPDRDIDSVRRFDTFTRDLIALADWLNQISWMILRKGEFAEVIEHSDGEAMRS